MGTKNTSTTVYISNPGILLDLPVLRFGFSVALGVPNC